MAESPTTKQLTMDLKSLKTLFIFLGIAIAAFPSHKDTEILAIQESLSRAKRSIAEITEKIQAIEGELNNEQKGEILQQELSLDRKANDELLLKLKHQKRIQEGFVRHYTQLLTENP